jgi:hypothetical protein
MGTNDRPVSIDTDTLRTMSNAHEAPKAIVTAARDNFRTYTDPLGKPWGDDKTGEAFARGYVPARDKLLEVLDSVVGALTTHQENFEKMANNSDATEQSVSK